ncbi:hypothetical protein WMF04_40435 [Sorangium sp. So ce260]|uniref:hypothetical protein n=1 Tax=Sorangium sp. So ce260 TaxID=3133291 RepID=UPI003F641BFD
MDSASDGIPLLAESRSRKNKKLLGIEWNDRRQKAAGEGKNCLPGCARSSALVIANATGGADEHERFELSI